MNTTAITFLRRVLLIDAATGVASGVLMTGGATALAGLMHLPPTLLRAGGLALFPIAAFIAFVGLRKTSSLPAVAVVVAGNLAWAAASAWVIVSDSLGANAYGSAFAAVQMLTVLVLSAFELRGALALRGAATSRAVAA